MGTKNANKKKAGAAAAAPAATAPAATKGAAKATTAGQPKKQKSMGSSILVGGTMLAVAVALGAACASLFFELQETKVSHWTTLQLQSRTSFVLNASRVASDRGWGVGCRDKLF
jgi:hypothetical protein